MYKFTTTSPAEGDDLHWWATVVIDVPNMTSPTERRLHGDRLYHHLHGSGPTEVLALEALRCNLWGFCDGIKLATVPFGGLDDPRNKAASQTYLRCSATATRIGELLVKLRRDERRAAKEAAQPTPEEVAEERAWREEVAMEAGMANGIRGYNEVYGHDSYSPEPCGQHCYDCPRCGY